MMREVEGGNTNWMMRILRHEAGHAIDSAFRLRRRRRWREIFGPASLPYPDSYRPRPGSRRFVQHLGSWYAQSHPTEDFAETFAVWLKRGPSWRRAYAGWPALEKLRYVDELMREISGTQAAGSRWRAHIEPRIACDAHAGRALSRTGSPATNGRSRAFAEELILRRFHRHSLEHTPRERRDAPAAAQATAFDARVARRLDASEYLIHQVMRLVIERCQDSSSTRRDPVRVARRRIEQLIYASRACYLVGSAGRHVL